MKKITVRQAINDTLKKRMRQDENMFIMGQDIAFYGGSMKATGGMYDEFGPERVRNTPLAEASTVYAAIGSAMMGVRAICEITYVDFMTLCMDTLLNQIGKWPYLCCEEDLRLPLVIRTQGGGFRGNGPHNSQSLEAFFTHIPGLIVVSPSTPFDFKGLLNASILDDNPVLFLEHKMLYNIKGMAPEEDYTIPFGAADVKRDGNDVTILAYSYMVHLALQAAAELETEGISVEVVDPRTLNPFDYTTLFQSVRKTRRLVVVSEDYGNTSFTKEIAAAVNEELFCEMDAPVACLNTLDVPLSYAKELEDYALPSVEKIKEKVRRSLAYSF